MLIEDTNRAIRQAEDERRRRRADRVRRTAPVAQLDAIIEDLERMHLDGRIKVSVVMMDRIERFLAALPAECRHAFPLRTSITRVMDNLYKVQDCLLTRKDDDREQFRSLDAALERDDYPAA